MKIVKEMVEGRMEVDFRFLVGELSTFSQDFQRLPVTKFLEIWGPEIKGTRIMLRLMEEKENEQKNQKVVD